MADVDETPETPVSPDRSARAPVTDVYRAVSTPPTYVRAADGDEDEDAPLGVLSGHFSVFNAPYRINDWWEGEFMERVAPGAFKNTFKRNGTNIKVMFEHGYDPTIGKKTLGKLRKIEEDDVGGYYEAALYDTSYNRDLEEPLRQGDYGASFRFRILKMEEDKEPKKTSWNPDGLPVRTITEAEVLEVGPCVWGASPTATASVRSATSDYLDPALRARMEEMRTTEDQHNEVREATTETAKEVPVEEPAVEPIEPEVRHEETANDEAESETESAVDETRDDETQTVAHEERSEDSSTLDEVPVSTEQKGWKHMSTSPERAARLDAIEERFANIDAEFPTAEYSDEVQAEVDSLEAERTKLQETEERFKKNQEAMAARSKAREEASRSVETPVERVGGAKVTDPEIYRNDTRSHSWVKDMYRAQYKQDRAATERLVKNDAHVRALTTVDGDGGEFVPPKWMMDGLVTLARAGRVTADQLNKMALPPGDAVSLPMVTGPAEVAEQATQNTAIAETDITTGSITADVKTVAGAQTLPVQLIDQSAINVDTIVFGELAKDYAIMLDNFVLYNDVANARGITNVSGLHAVDYTEAAPTAGKLYPKVADAIQRIHTTRFASPTRIVMHPVRWADLLSSLDTTGRPLVVPSAQAPSNVLAAVGGIEAEGFVGSMQGLPVFVDPNISTAEGVGTDQDQIIVMKADDLWLFEGTPKAEVFRETKANTLSVYLRFYNYVALQASRYPKSIAVIDGTGLIAPSFA